jgi:hypothetical protein
MNKRKSELAAMFISRTYEQLMDEDSNQNS